MPISFSIPIERLRSLEFLLGESVGLETLYPPEGAPVQFQAFVNGSWESCERFIKIDFFGDIPGVGPETFRAMITYSEKMGCYRMWAFAATQEEPMHMCGDFEGESLVFVGDPTPMLWGFQRLRFRFDPNPDGSIEFLGERWEPDGYAKYCSVVFRPTESIMV